MECVFLASRVCNTLPPATSSIINTAALYLILLILLQVVDISDSINQRYLVPYNSSAKFGLVYCPGVKNECYYFEKVSDIIQSDDMPKVVTCTKKAKNRSNSDANISPNEVLIVVEVSCI